MAVETVMAVENTTTAEYESDFSTVHGASGNDQVVYDPDYLCVVHAYYLLSRD